MYTGYTSCPEKALAVERIWNNGDNDYSALSHNCQLYVNVMKKVLNNCPDISNRCYTYYVKK